jgi:hypothetical protein
MEDRLFQTLDEYADAQIGLIEDSRRAIDWLDHNLSETVAAMPAIADVIRGLLASSPLARVRLLLENDAWFWRFCPRLIAVRDIYGHAFEIRVLDEADRPLGEHLLMSERGVIRRFHPDAMRGELSANGRVMSLARQRFESLWQRAHTASSGRRLGI